MYRNNDHQFSAQGGLTASSNIILFIGPDAIFGTTVISAKYSTAKAGVSLQIFNYFKLKALIRTSYLRYL